MEKEVLVRIGVELGLDLDGLVRDGGRQLGEEGKV